MKLDRWLRVRTFHHSAFSDIRRLVALKESQGVTISLCFPTLNEEETIGKEIRVLKSELMDKFRLLDEIAVVDSGSTDKTREIAVKEGATVYLASEHLAELGVWYGKGENLWKSLFLLKGDIIVWVDSDIRNIHPRFVYGLVGPLLTNSRIGYVKGFYKRPIKLGRKLLPTGGGRVTELVARPVLNILFPSLSGLAQPLSGEYAGRRSILERVPFFTGYGVEIGLLLDIERKFGLRQIAQVDLDVRVHRNQELESLRKMSHRILTVLLTKAEEQGKVAILSELNRSMNLITKEDEYYRVHNLKIEGTQRPPMITVNAYQQARGISEEDLVIFGDLETSERREYQKVSGLLRENLIKPDVVATTKREAIRELVEKLAEEGAVSSVKDALEALMTREDVLSTGIGMGLAIPHAATEATRELTLCVGISAEGVEFESLDGEPVRLIFLVLCPPSERAKYLSTLASLSRLLDDERLSHALVAAGGRKEVLTIVRKFETLKSLTREFEKR
ncbi:MAG: glucosyl-3-phosphoglycerate synthase [Candidatus Eisenbacteria bacterium]|nr:glucosyl-3-phosphoglycerate synthase [Candidatus Eisenbacteria bacterium]